MSWASLALRKMTLKNRVNDLNTQLVQISQKMQEVSNDLSYEQRNKQLQYDYDLSVAEDTYEANWETINRVYEDGKVRNTVDGMAKSIFGIELPSLELFGSNTGHWINKRNAEIEGLTLFAGEYNDLQDLDVNYWDSKNNREMNASDNYETASFLVEKDYAEQKQKLEKEFNDENKKLQEQADRQSKSLEAQQTQLETQLAAAQAELGSLTSAIDSDIKNNAIKLSS